ncbi:MAG: DNA polymerase III subunit beta [Prevotellaceae bacterium]|jgi:DNA polymerase-3 subunit beta|nr:DNA polymerase III subunit beta [Prevotellaceae bacterium]
MNFVVSSSELLNRLQTISKVISNKNTLPILDNFLFQLKGNELKITACDLEITFVTTLNIENVTSEGEIAIPAKRLTDLLREFSEQPLTFKIDKSTSLVEIRWNSGKSNITGANVDEFPTLPIITDETRSTIDITSDALFESINRTLFATADDQLRPVMNGIYFDLNEENKSLTFVASDAHKLVRYTRNDVTIEKTASFILPKKPASLLRSILTKEEENVKIEFDGKNVLFSLNNYMLVCRLIEGIYPSYNSVIPQNNPNKVTVDRVDFLNSIRRVATFSNQVSNLIKLKIAGNELTSYAQDLDFSVSGDDCVTCQYDGSDMEIGFKSTFLIEILANINSQDVVIELADSARAALFIPFDKSEKEDLIMLLMPMMIN